MGSADRRVVGRNLRALSAVGNAAGGEVRDVELLSVDARLEGCGEGGGQETGGEGEKGSELHFDG